MNAQAHGTSPIIEVTTLTRDYRSGKKKGSPFTAVDGICFDVQPGEVFGLLGTNGAGKTSTLDVIEGLAAPTHGSVSIMGLDPIKDRTALRPHMGIMLQNGGLPSQLTVAETLRMWAGTCSRARDWREIIEAVHLGDHQSTKVSALSGGEQRRLDLACALVGNPSIIVLDEPTTGLDPESRHDVWNLLLSLKEAGVTMVLTTHYLEEAERLCDRIAIMHDGAIAVEGTLREIVSSTDADITFQVARSSMPQLPHLPGARVDWEERGEGTLVHVSTSHVVRDTRAILEWADTHDITLDQFAATPPSLEKVFLKIAGRGTAPALNPTP